MPVFLFSAAAARIEVHGHRGARAVLPENTLPAFEHAIAAGADAVELDVVVTKDNVPVVSHDPVLSPAICTGPRERAVVRELTLAELREWDCGSKRNPAFPRQRPVPGARIPTLDEVLALAGRGSFHFNIETKISPRRPEYAPAPEEFARLVLEAIRRHNLEPRVIVQSFDFRVLRAIRRLAPEIRLAALFETDQREFAAIAGEAQADIASPQHRLVTAEKVKAAQAAGISVIAWTANTPEEWDRLIAAQVDGIITDDPDALIGYLKEKRLR